MAKKPAGRSASSGGSRRIERRPGLPKSKSITGQRTFTSPQGGIYRILSTDEKDAYEGKGAKAAIGEEATKGKGKAKQRSPSGKNKPKPARKPKSVP